MIRVLLVDDHALVRTGFALLLQTTSDMRVVAQAESGEEALRLLDGSPGSPGAPGGRGTFAAGAVGANNLPDVVVMDLTLGGVSGLQATQRLLARHPTLRVLAVSMHEDLAVVRQMLRAGALGYVTKASAPEVLVDAIREVAAGRPYVEPTLARRLFDAPREESDHPAELLSRREFEVFLHLAAGLTVNRVAQRLSLSPRTVGSHLYTIKAKLGVEHQTELALIAVRYGLINTLG